MFLKPQQVVKENTTGNPGTVCQAQQHNYCSFIFDMSIHPLHLHCLRHTDFAIIITAGIQNAAIRCPKQVIDVDKNTKQTKNETMKMCTPHFKQ